MSTTESHRGTIRRVRSDNIRILHVDDESKVAEVTSTFLERTNDDFEVWTSTSPTEALGKLDDHSFDCIVSDYQMPEMNGVEFLEAVRERDADIPFILYTGKGSEEVAADAIRAGSTDYLQKQTGEEYELLANRIRNAVSEYWAKRTERDLMELAEITDHILYIFNQDWSELLFLNSAYEDIWGRSVEAVREDPTDLLNGVHPDDRGLVKEKMAKISDGESVTVEHRVNEAEDYGRWVRVRGKPITDEAGTVVRAAGFVTEITEQKEMQQRLRERTERLEEAQRVAGVGSWEWDAVSDTVVWSDETYRIFGWDLDEMPQPTFEDWIEAVHPADRERAQEAVGEAIETGSFSTFEHRLQQPDGSVKWVRCRGDVTMEDGEVSRITGTVMEITESKQRQRELERQNERLEKFASVLSHDLRAPLSVANDRLGLALEEFDSEDLEAVEQAHDRMTEIIDDTLTLARMGERVDEFETVSMDRVVEDCWTNVETGEATLRSETDLQVEADEGRLERLLENLLQNAVEHGGDDVTVRVGKLDDGFFIADDGPGISPEDRADVFERGYSTNESGTGFGLAIVREIVNSQGWDIDVTESTDGGARFEITGVDRA